MNKKIIILFIIISLISISLISVQGTDGGGAPAPTPANTSGGGGGAAAPVPDNSTSGGGGGTANPMGIISGKILPADSNATVYALLRSQIVGSSTINDKGEYSIQLPMAVYNLRIAGQGDYINRTIYHIVSKGGNEITEVQDIVLAKIGETGSISGYVNPPIEGITVQIKKVGSEEFTDSSIVDSNGRYEITGLEPDTYGLVVYFDSSLPSQNFFTYRWDMIDIGVNSSVSLNLTFTPKNVSCAVDRIWIDFTDELSGSEKKRRAIIESYNSQVMSYYSYSSSYTINIPSDKTVNETIALFKTNSYIRLAEPLCNVWSFGDIESEQDTTQNENNNIQNTNPEELQTLPNYTQIQDLPSIDNTTEEQSQDLPIENVPKRIDADEPKEDSFFSKIIDFFKQLFGLGYNNPNLYRIESIEQPTAGNNISNISEEIRFENNITTNIIEEVDSIKEENITQEENKSKEILEKNMSIVDANNQFALELYSKLKSNSKNMFFSPYSISSALAMTYEGARGETAKEMQAVFHFPIDDNFRRASYANLTSQLNKEDVAYKLNTANALWAQEDYQFLQEYFDIVEKYYSGKVTNLDFKTSSENSRKIINSWVEEKTNNKIKDLIPPRVLDSMTRLVLTNAIYFKGTWFIQFDKTKTNNEDFKISPNNVVKVSMMSAEGGEFNYAETEELQILEMLYEGDKLSMLVLLPKENNMDSLEKSISIGKLSEWKNMLKENIANVYMPKFSFKENYFMKETLSNMGMPIAFSEEADFSGMDGTKKLFIDNVIHQAFVEVNEEGTEAAAATAVIMKEEGEGGKPEIIIFRADHPFIFIIQERKTGNILFLGKVIDPR